jgi:hypothetical protein
MKKIPMLEKFAAQSLVEYDGELIFSKEKFAELIIEECAKVVEKNLYQGIGWNTARKVKEHFGIGVEE